MGVELTPNTGLSVLKFAKVVRIGCKLPVAAFADTEYGYAFCTFYDSELATWHEASLTHSGGTGPLRKSNGTTTRLGSVAFADLRRTKRNPAVSRQGSDVQSNLYASVVARPVQPCRPCFMIQRMTLELL